MVAHPAGQRELAMRIELTTFQSRHVRQWLAHQRIYRARWHRGGRLNPWNRAYAWMSIQMSRRGLSTAGYPPVWAWPRAPALGGPPTYVVADGLLSEVERDAGIWAIDVSVPACFTLLSCYRLWNAVLDDMIDGRTVGATPPWLFDRPPYRHPRPLEPDDIQVCLPFLNRNWIRDVRPLPRHPVAMAWDRPV